MDKETVIETIKESVQDGFRFQSEYNGKIYNEKKRDPEEMPWDKVFPDLKIKIKVVHSKGGGEGEGDYVERVLKVDFNEETFFVQITASYQSYNGICWDYGRVYEVVPYQQMVTMYKELKPDKV